MLYRLEDAKDVLTPAKPAAKTMQRQQSWPSLMPKERQVHQVWHIKLITARLVGQSFLSAGRLQLHAIGSALTVATHRAIPPARRAQSHVGTVQTMPLARFVQHGRASPT